MPAAAVIPAPIAYIKVVAVKKLVVGFLPRTVGPPLRVSIWMALGIFSEDCICTSLCGAGIRNLYFEEIRVFQACACGEYISME